MVSLVLRKAKGFKKSNASELTKIINEHMAINVNRPKISANNMSRELRKDSILKLSWLNYHENGRQPLFSLNEKWSESWEEYFNNSAPII